MVASIEPCTDRAALELASTLKTDTFLICLLSTVNIGLILSIHDMQYKQTIMLGLKTRSDPYCFNQARKSRGMESYHCVCDSATCGHGRRNVT